MPNIKSAKKRVRITKTKTLRNKMIKSNLKTVLKQTFLAIEKKEKAAQESVSLAFKKLDKAVAKGIIHKNKASNKKSSLQLAYNNMLKTV